MTTYLLLVLPVFCLFGFFLMSLIPKSKEKWIGSTVVYITSGHLILTLFLIFSFFSQSNQMIETNQWVIYKGENFIFSLSFFLDKIGLVFLMILSLLTFVISFYARVYLNREVGFKRFFLTLVLFLLGYTIVVLSSGFEMLFAGWEIVGLASFLLISFYSYRIRPVKNALRVFSLYRLADVGLLLGAWMVHNLWHMNPSFKVLQNLNVDGGTESTSLIIITSFMFILTSAIKSAQYPFSFWLPKAMEGPTPSSAIFYGSLAVHLGIFLLLRTQPIWEHSLFAKFLIVFVGLSSAIIGTGMAQVQANIKAQMAYASVSQVGIIFIEVALGFIDLALFHFAGHAFLRAYQILISSSVVSYLVGHHNRLNTEKQNWMYKILVSNFLISKFGQNLRTSLFVFFFREGIGEKFFENLIWKNMKIWGKVFNSILFANRKLMVIFIFILFSTAFVDTILGLSLLGLVAAFVAVASAFSALQERQDVNKAWMLTGFSQIFTLVAVINSDKVPFNEIFIFSSGILFFWILGFLSLYSLKAKSLNGFGMSLAPSSLKNIMLLMSCLGVSGFPISPAFIGEDLILLHANRDNLWLAVLIAFCFVSSGISAIRIFSRVSLGHKTSLK